MQTLDSESSRRKRRGVPALVVAAVAVVVATAALGYAVGSSKSKTKTVVQTVAAVAAPTPNAASPKATAPTCLKGVGAGSCNIDEAQEALIPDKPLDAGTRAVLAAQLVTAREVALKYPTVADAEKAGMILAGAFSPLTGAHYINLGDALAAFDPAKPGSYIYDGTSPTSKIIGLMYLSGDVNPPEGFAGPNDHWHRHTNTCVIFGGPKIVVPFPADSSVTKSMCDAKKGTFMRRTTWMVHAWVVPGWDSPSGVFAHDNADVLCKDGTIKASATGFCQGT